MPQESDWMIVEYKYLKCVEPRTNTNKFYAVYVLYNPSTGQRYAGASYGRISHFHSSGGVQVRLSDKGQDDPNAVTRFHSQIELKYSRGYEDDDQMQALIDNRNTAVWVKLPNGARRQLKRTENRPPQPAQEKQRPQPTSKPSLQRDIWILVHPRDITLYPDDKTFATASLTRGDGWFIPIKKEVVGVIQSPLLGAERKGMAKVRCTMIVDANNQIRLDSFLEVLEFLPDKEDPLLCSFTQLR